MRLVFAGTPAAAVPTLRLLAAQHKIVAVVTRPDAPLGRKRVLTPSPVAAAAEELDLPVIKAARLDEHVTTQIQALAPELGVIVAYGGLVREPLLSAPTHGWINLHFSLLPRWRGAAPVQRSLIAADAALGVSVFQLVPALDAGDLFAVETLAVAEQDTAGDVLTNFAEAGAPVVARVVDTIASGTAKAIAQVGDVTLAAKLMIEDGALTWTEPAEAVYARFRGVTPEPGAHTTVSGARLKILAARPSAEQLPAGEIRAAEGGVLIGTASTALLVSRVQPAGKGPMNAADWWRGIRDEPKAGS